MKDAITVAAADRNHPDADGLPSPAGAELTVTRLDGRRVDRLTLRRVPAPVDQHPEEARS
ncbi:hypothetical protein KBX06_26055 [Micromonospora sp. C31]|uniref:hypothetical protein n=1 Tax=Micromonospora sp. C31 TaxID=2824876 RepID=UPI001B38573B|nr:hypothetical protein [Micromonospora sp. C31]MBQ1076591.1 hypothetical protein [Micromonospora sp. C31]